MPCSTIFLFFGHHCSFLELLFSSPLSRASSHTDPAGPERHPSDIYGILEHFTAITKDSPSWAPGRNTSTDRIVRKPRPQIVKANGNASWFLSPVKNAATATPGVSKSSLLSASICTKVTASRIPPAKALQTRTIFGEKLDAYFDKTAPSIATRKRTPPHKSFTVAVFIFELNCTKPLGLSHLYKQCLQCLDFSLGPGRQSWIHETLWVDLSTDLNPNTHWDLGPFHRETRGHLPALQIHGFLSCKIAT